MIKKFISSKSKIFITIFILLQPFIDVFTNVSNSKFHFSVGIILRTLFLLYAIVGILFSDKKNKKFNFLFFSILFIFIFVFFTFCCKDFSIFIYKLNSLFKFLYFPIVTLFFYQNIKEECYEFIIINGFFIALLMILAQVFGGVVLSYDSGKMGNSGWFFSPNELSSICSIIIPIVYTSFISNKNKFTFLTFILLSFSMLIIGTKTAFLSIFITLVLINFYLIYNFLFKKKNNKLMIIITTILTLIFILISPFTYAYKNVKTYDKNEKISELTLSGRDKIKKKNLKGINFNVIKGIYFNSKKSYEFERDFYNIYYNFGINGIVMFTIVPLYIIISSSKKKRKFSIQKFGAMISIALAIGISYIAGHTLLFPAVSIYIAFLFVNIFSDKNNNKKKVIFISSVGGHLTQMLELKKIFSDYDYVLITEKTPVTKSMTTNYNMNFLVYGSRKYIFKYLFIFSFNILKSMYLYIKYTPDVIVTTGTHTAVPMCYIGYLFGKKIIYIESFAKRTSPTLTGRIVYPIATTFVVQWESMLKFYPKAKFWGGIY